MDFGLVGFYEWLHELQEAENDERSSLPLEPLVPRPDGELPDRSTGGARPVKEESFRCLSSPKTSRHLVKKAIDELGEYLCDEDLLYELELVLLEACANVVMHAYPEGSGMLEVTTRVAPKRFVEFEIVNWGKRFAGPCTPVEAVGPEAESGRGLLIIHRIMDTCRYDQQGEKNVLVLHKDIKERLWMNCK